MLLGRPSQPDAEAAWSRVSLFLPFQPDARHVSERVCNDFSPRSPLSTATQKPEQELHRCKQSTQRVTKECQFKPPNLGLFLCYVTINNHKIFLD